MLLELQFRYSARVPHRCRKFFCYFFIELGRPLERRLHCFIFTRAADCIRELYLTKVRPIKPRELPAYVFVNDTTLLIKRNENKRGDTDEISKIKNYVCVL